MKEQATMMNQQQQQQHMNMNQSLMSMNQMIPRPPQQPQQQSQMVQMNHGYGMWTQPQQFQNPNMNPVAMNQPSSAFNKSSGPRNNWKGKRVNKPRRTEQQQSLIAGCGTGGVNVVGGAGGGGNLNFKHYNPPTLNELQHQNWLKTRKFFQKKKFNKNLNSMNMNMNMSGNNGRFAPYAPRNTTSFIIRAKKSGGIAPLVSPYPLTPAVLPTPILSPSGEVLGDMAKEEWGLDGYGSMKGLIRLRSPGHEEEDEGDSSESDVEEHVEVERRLDHDLSRFEMICDPNSVGVSGMEYHNVLENMVDDQDTHIAQLEEENLILKERLFLMERELGDLRRRLFCLERSGNQEEDTNEEVVENMSENESVSHDEEAHLTEDNIADLNNEEDRSNHAHIAETTEKVAHLHVEGKLEYKDEENVISVANETSDVPAREDNEESIKEGDNPEEKNAERG